MPALSAKMGVYWREGSESNEKRAPRESVSILCPSVVLLFLVRSFWGNAGKVPPEMHGQNRLTCLRLADTLNAHVVGTGTTGHRERVIP